MIFCEQSLTITFINREQRFLIYLTSYTRCQIFNSSLNLRLSSTLCDATLYINNRNIAHEYLHEIVFTNFRSAKFL